MKQIQIPEEFFILLMKYHLLDMEEMQPEIKKGLMDKMDMIIGLAFIMVQCRDTLHTIIPMEMIREHFQ